ncbi:ABC transporter, phosphonate, periplasmic substrate-binding protein [Posidoniimonas polymericola]|uniref:ABC transporter, phosphonate, periplasmic substrate-binding protein n=1 Tax=Posidoniimonas polymericola TaxID=2528002 RepID=A0A5C5YQR2_9BACT|nr:phosphate/phosphite/phosphonate ABC transporter substrate-binding protein [Posidoniimonas polymericola]TWT77256.1 ABC transporter, phosphonate, periplasmic substrate-binding protein [Posidoniimonas polymericola]
MDANTESSQGSSVLRTLLVAVPAAAVTAFAVQWWGASLQQSATDELNKNVLSVMLPDWADSSKLAADYKDANQDLVADTPTDEAKLQSPETLVFSYIAEEGDESDQTTEADGWGALATAVGDATGLPVKVRAYEQVNDQLEAMRTGELHILGLGTGAAPLAVNTAGYVPLCTMANADGEVGYKMLLVAAADAGIKDLADIKGSKVVFVRPTSNSGFKAALVQLYNDAGLLPERDYEWSFSMSHEGSMKDVVAGRARVAPVASDILAKMLEQGDIDEAEYTILYESEAFPPAVIGCAHDLPAEMVDQIRTALVGLDWAGTDLEQRFGPTGSVKFVAVDYKDDWAVIRRIDDAMRNLSE